MAKTKKGVDQPEQVSTAQYWLDEIKRAEDSFSKWHERAKKVVDRYRDERSGQDNHRRKFNILWSNTQVMKPALYGRMPKPEVSRRYNDQDAVGRTAAMIQERALEYEVEEFPDYNQAMSGAVEDRLLPGRGVAWVRYELDEETGNECAPTDYVHWQDFLHNPARTWDEVWWVAKRVYMTKEEGEARFGPIFLQVPIEMKKESLNDRENPKDSLKDKAQVWEIWDKHTKEVCWVAKGFRNELDRKPDPLQLEKFFPCPRPLYATTTTGSLIPVPDYCEYQDQAEELDLISQRISLLTKALKVRGVYNAEYKSIKRLLTETEDNELIPVDSWAAFAEKGGLKGAVDWLPIDMVANVLTTLFEAREQCLTVIYQTIGLSDIMRGSTDSDETLGAQQLKANFGSMRLRSTQAEVARFATDLLRLKAEIQCRFYSPEKLLEMAGIAQTLDGQNQEQVQQAVALLKEARLKDFRISIESDTLAQIDEGQEKQEMVEFVTSLGTMLKESVPVIQGAPALLPAIGETIKLVIRKQRAGRAIEAAWDQALQAAAQQMSGPQGIPPEVQEQIQAAQEEIAKKGQELQAQEQDLFKRETEHKVAQFQFDAQKQVADTERKAQDEVRAAKQQAEQSQAEAQTQVQDQGRQIGEEKLLMQVQQLISQHGAAIEKIVQNATTDLTISEVKSDAKRKAAGEKQKDEKEEGRSKKVVEQVAAANEKLGETIGQAIIKGMSQPKRIVRGKDGRAEGVEVAT